MSATGATPETRRLLAERIRYLRDLGVSSLRIPRGRLPTPAEPRRATAPAGAPADGKERLAALREELGDCTRCRLCEKRTHLVFGDGDPAARLLFVGEGPGFEEDRQGLPFVGRAGQLLNRIIESIGLRREQVYIANVVKCRPPENRTPLPDEIATCSAFLLRQIQAIRPEVVCALGNVAAQTLLQTSAPMSRIRGEFRSLPDGTLLMPTYHPAYLLRNPEKKREVWEDVKKVRDALGLPERR